MHPDEPADPRAPRAANAGLGGLRVVVVGPLVRDVSVQVGVLPDPNSSAIARQLVAAAGGKGGNPAFTAAQLGAQVHMVGAVGADDTGTQVLRELRDAGIDTDAVAIVAGAATGQIVHVVEADGTRRYVESPGINGTFVPDQIAITGACEQRTVVLVSTALPADAVRSAVIAGQNAGAWVVADAAGPPDTTRLVLDDVDMVRGDADEITALTGITVRDEDTAIDAAQTMIGTPRPSVVVVQAGEHGNVIVTDQQNVRLPNVQAPTVDATGAGDALVTTLTVLLAAGYTLPHAGRLASAAAAHTAGQLGPRTTFNGLQDLERFLHDS